MAEGILGLGSGQAASLNQELIDKLKTAERAATVEPIETSIESIESEKEVFTTISEKVEEVLDSIKIFDLFVTGGVTAFDQKTATATGDSVVFDAADVSLLNEGVTTVDIKNLAQKDAYQSNAVDGTTKDTALTSLGDLIINVAGVDTTIDTEGKTYEELVSEIDKINGINASLEQVGSDSYRLVLKSSESGVDNKITITDSGAGNALGLVGTGNEANHTLVAQDMKALVDGIEYNLSSNSLEVDGLKIAATEEGVSSINITKDNTTIETSMNTFIEKYNELVALVDEEVYSADSDIADKAALKDIVNQIKDKLFGSYGENSDKSIFSFGFELSKDGSLSLDSTTFNAALDEDLDAMKDIFIGSAENKGLGTQIKELIDNMGFSDGVIGLYESSMQDREDVLNEDKENAEEILDAKYTALAAQFGTYSAIITQYESSFSGLSLMIEQSTASS
ncbi:flagellar filament capping protein FliD [Poseidonibacter ostreae]|jgi:flagellar hook-associated protein 2|uniref:Flagellar hook-associated protein 2 n=1 Tax=Poseidonibacter ostreae TaxID=2654171 RepID=A0A6L4WNB9_9BACT|nr:flagellar filament capping protein FliD [Poseidonibacter ostreae]KAB7884409.1 flagellar filament capping protein FliD [Poseidonibacter ostreae]KAB7885940.1 flagellar filament capping protein FliD [Poseidonibacter ostreae]KAB7886656.1 flagellar filament capping protein FliD [Poseidonibacter ostreae]MAC83345.1 flagellar hook protein FliD [Arcobacter sp.]|tara:strand:+ start:5737 stop:7092 length:1356 start_codon:yes stop_codon:yes gene_type:complete